ncbi:endopeptidase La [bacterium]|nr:endopeptidase La [bacterium]
MVLTLLPLRDIVVFPHMIIPLFVGRSKSIKAVEKAISANNSKLILATQKDAKVDEPADKDIFRIGTIAEILQVLKLPDGTIKVLVEGTSRAQIIDFIGANEYFEVCCQEVNIDVEITPQIEALMRNILDRFEVYCRINIKAPREMLETARSISEPGRFADMVSTNMSLKLTDKQSILEAIHPEERLARLSEILNEEIEILNIERRIRGRIKKQMERSQKEYYLNEQMKAIQKELGSIDNRYGEIKELDEKIKQAKMPKDIEEKAQKELKRMELMPPMSAEATVVRNYIDWLVSIPWSTRTRDKLDLQEAEDILEKDHYGLDKPKERILEYLAVRRLVKKMKGPILCFVGPPGVGKTSLARSVARAIGRKFVRLSLGGVRDEAEIRGHRRTYIGALPGRIIQSMKKAKSKNPVILMDEVDKMSTDFRGDPSSALLEVLDPEQNNSFSDHYLEVEYDLSEVMFITTANVIHRIPQPLQDRMEVIDLPGYTDYEKVNIAKRFLVPKQLKAHGLKDENIEFSDNALNAIIHRYTREAGVRNLEREIASVCRKVARRVVKEGMKAKINITSQCLAKYLGVPKYREKKSEQKDEVGIATGLAWTEAGGDILVVEATIMEGKPKLTLTGKLGDVMQESAQAALSYLRSRGKEMGLSKDFFQNKEIHVHVPEGAIPKDGPSAGITIATAMASLVTKKAVRGDLAMTGEITLRGKVLPIGGLKEKILAAHRAEITTIIIPKENEKDLKEIPKTILKSIHFILVEHMDQVLKEALIDYDKIIPFTEENQLGNDKTVESSSAPMEQLIAH